MCKISLRGSSRTDTGVHALKSSAHFDLCHPSPGKIWTPSLLKQRLNKMLTLSNEYIRIESIMIVPRSFDAKYHPVSKTYTYLTAIPPPCTLPKPGLTVSDPDGLMSTLEADSKPEKDLSKPHRSLNMDPCYEEPLWMRNRVYAFHCCDFKHDLVRDTVPIFLGHHDFATFMAQSHKSSPPVTVRSIEKASYEPIISTFDQRKPSNTNDSPTPSFVDQIFSSQGNASSALRYYRFTFTSRGFLYKQVRKMVGALLALGCGKIVASDIAHMLDNPDLNNWNNRVDMAPPTGLYLTRVKFDDKDLTAFTEESPNYKVDGNGVILQTAY